MANPSPTARPPEANVCRRSWMRVSSNPAIARIRRQGRCRSVKCDPEFLPTITNGFFSKRGRVRKRAMAAAPRCIVFAPVLLSGSLS
jgi:hypothetical protein